MARGSSRRASKQPLPFVASFAGCCLWGRARRRSERRSRRMPTGVATAPPLLEFSSRDGSLWVNGAPLILKGINWYGFETEQGSVHGLYAQPISYFMELLSSNEFNAVRLPLDLDLILNDREHGFILPETAHDPEKTPSPPPYWANSSASPPRSRSGHPSSSPPPPDDEVLYRLRRTPVPPLRRRVGIAPDTSENDFDGRLFAFLFIALALFPGVPLMFVSIAIAWRRAGRRRLPAEAAATSTGSPGSPYSPGSPFSPGSPGSPTSSGPDGGLKSPRRRASPETQGANQTFSWADLLGLAVAALALLALAAFAALHLTTGLQRGLGNSVPELEWEDFLGDGPTRGDLHQLGACNIYKAASPMVTDAWCESSCKGGACPKDLCEKRPTPKAICHTPPSPLMKNTSLELLDVLIDRFADEGILVLLDLHCLAPASEINGFIYRGGTDASRLFFDQAHTAADAVKGWRKLASRFADRWNVLGIDVFNEPADGTWAEGEASDMDAFAREVATVVHKQAPNWLIFVQGTANSPEPIAIIDGAKVRSGLGDNLMGAMARPLELAARDKLVYSPHAYGPAVHAARKEYSHADFPSNMPHVWEAHWGGLAQPGAPAVVLGEWGTSLVGKDALWAEELATYLKAKNVTSTFFWALNPAGKEGSGLIKVLTGRGASGKGVPSVDGAKLDLLRRVTPHPTDILEVYRAARARALARARSPARSSAASPRPRPSPSPGPAARQRRTGARTPSSPKGREGSGGGHTRRAASEQRVTDKGDKTDKAGRPPRRGELLHGRS